MLGVLIVTKGRDSIYNSLDTILPELRKGDQVLIVTDGEDICIETNHPQVTVIKESKEGYYGHPLRQKYQNYFTNIDYILNVDDDDFLQPLWRSFIDTTVKRESPDLVVCNYYTENDYLAIKTMDFHIAPITGNVIFRNIPELTSIPWGNFVGGDTARVLKMYKQKEIKVYKSDFVLFKKN